ncbi:MAG: AEC family transporter [Rubricella sp.]
MIAVFLETLPFFLLVGLGYAAAAAGFFPQAAVAWLTRFVFFFALSAMLFRFAATLPVSQILDLRFMGAYLLATGALYVAITAFALIGRRSAAEAAVEAQCATIGNVGFLAIPMLVALMGEAAAPAVLMVLTVDLIVFGSLIVLIITGSRDGRLSPAVLVTMGKGLLRNPMVMSITAGLAWSLMVLPIPDPAMRFLDILGAAATPCALFAIGASLAGKAAERPILALWLSTAKLVLHPALVALCALVLFEIDPFMAAVMIATAAMPTAGNVFMIAQHYGVAPQRASSTILVSTVASVVTLSFVLSLLDY